AYGSVSRIGKRARLPHASKQKWMARFEHGGEGRGRAGERLPAQALRSREALSQAWTATAPRRRPSSRRAGMHKACHTRWTCHPAAILSGNRVSRRCVPKPEFGNEEAWALAARHKSKWRAVERRRHFKRFWATTPLRANYKIGSLWPN